MLTQRIPRNLVALALLAGTAVCGGAWAQTPTPTPNGQFLCSDPTGLHDGQACSGDDDCAPAGVCVIAQGVCNDGANDTLYCGCIASTCSPSTSACNVPAPGPTPGVCDGGPNVNDCCQASDDSVSGYVANCTGGLGCTGTQKVCSAGDNKGVSCLNDTVCSGPYCESTGRFCNGGDFDRYACVDTADCDNVDGSTGGDCLGAGQPTPTATPGGCAGDCDGSGQVTADGLTVLVNIALGNAPAASCSQGIPSDADVDIALIIEAVNNALNGCGVRPPTGEFLCSAGPNDGRACNSDSACAPGGVCVIAQGVCNGGADDTLYCGCISGTCSPSTPACAATVTGVCVGGANATECCDETNDPSTGYVANCAGGVACSGTQKVCAAGDNKGVSCLNDTVCGGPYCQSTGKFCNGGDFDGYACVDASDCLNADGTSVGTCDAAAAAALTPLESAQACLVVDQRPAAGALSSAASLTGPTSSCSWG